ncbi:peptidoglycan-binding domain-containing protein [Jonesia quinghaiensis]|uniref:peptidoglycan-binding domain-containing protein n=1 Tax=Jonesia quinghaiensis TaxID=262806 RepID=UPI00146D9CA0|nr:peptidoglycan-binding domain-containing protein [Jonesia quinghaiensis]
MLSIAVALGIGGAAAWAVLSPPTTEQTVVSDPTYTVAQETITRSSQFTADIAWSTADAGVFGGGGTVTSIGVASGDTVTAGQLLYTVDLKPVYVAQGEVPAFRDLTLGVTGDDVAQLQAFLAEHNHFWANANGTFGPATLTAVKAWQRATGQEETGVVTSGTLVFLSDLPRRVTVPEAVTVGARIAEGTVILHDVSATPTVTFTVGSNSEPPLVGTPVSLVVGENTWDGMVSAVADKDGAVVATVTSKKGKPICGKSCSKIPLSITGEQPYIVAQLVPEATGPVVPVSAIATSPDGSSYVVTTSGDKVPVTIEATDGSRVVVSGVDTGQVVKLYATGTAPGSSQPSSTSSEE